MHKFPIRLAICMAFLATSCGSAIAAPKGPPSPSGRFDDPSTDFEFALDISDEESKAQFNFGGSLVPPPDLRKSNDPNKVEPISKRSDLTWKAGIEFPLGGTDNILDDATLDALGDGPKLSGSLNVISYSFDPNLLGSSEFDKLMIRARKACTDQARSEADKLYCKEAEKAENFVREYLPSAVLEMNRILYRSYTSYSLKSGFGFNKFKFVDPTTLSDRKKSKSSYSLAGTIVNYPSDGVSAWKIESEYARAFKGSEETIVCKPVIADPSKDCVKATPNGPEKTETLVIRGEYRRYFPFRTGKGGIGAALTSSIDTLSGDAGIELPIYLSLPGNLPVSPGIKFGYTTEKKDVTFAVFLKSSFSF